MKEVGHTLKPLSVNTEGSGNEGRGATVHIGYNLVLRHIQKMYRILGRRSCMWATQANLNLIRNCSGLWGLGNRGPDPLQFLNNNNNKYSRRLTRLRSCIKNATGCQKCQGLWVFENSTNKVKRYVSNRNG
jgi:hypothetical protein